MNIVDVLDYISVKYVIIVICLMEITTIYIPMIAHTLHRKWVILAISFLVGVGMLGYTRMFLPEVNIHSESSRLFISFLFTVAFHSIFVKPIVQGIKNRFTANPNKEEDANTDTERV